MDLTIQSRLREYERVRSEIDIQRKFIVKDSPGTEFLSRSNLLLQESAITASDIEKIFPSFELQAVLLLHQVDSVQSKLRFWKHCLVMEQFAKKSENEELYLRALAGIEFYHLVLDYKPITTRSIIEKALPLYYKITKFRNTALDAAIIAGRDIGVSMLIDLAGIQADLGFCDEASRHWKEACQLAEYIKHPPTDILLDACKLFYKYTRFNFSIS